MKKKFILQMIFIILPFCNLSGQYSKSYLNNQNAIHIKFLNLKTLVVIIIILFAINTSTYSQKKIFFKTISENYLSLNEDIDSITFVVNKQGEKGISLDNIRYYLESKLIEDKFNQIKIDQKLLKIFEKYDIQILYKNNTWRRFPDGIVNHKGMLIPIHNFRKTFKNTYCIVVEETCTNGIIKELLEQDIINMALGNQQGSYFNNPQLIPNDYNTDLTWHLKVAPNSGHQDADLDAFRAWYIWNGSEIIGQRKRIGVFGNGVPLHPDLENNRSPGGDELQWTGEEHELNVAGIIAAENNNYLGSTNTTRGCSVAWNSATFISYLCADGNGLPDNSDFVDDIFTAINEDIDIFNVSFGFYNNLLECDYSFFYFGLHDAIETAYNAGIIMVASAGNNPGVEAGVDVYPAAFPEVISIGNSTKQAERDDDSNYFTCNGTQIFALAPGEGIYTTGYNSGGEPIINYFNGTSAASPVATGVIALLMSYTESLGYNLEFGQIKAILSNTAEKIDEANANYVNGYSITHGYGKINAYRALLNLTAFNVENTYPSDGGVLNTFENNEVVIEFGEEQEIKETTIENSISIVGSQSGVISGFDWDVNEWKNKIFLSLNPASLINGETLTIHLANSLMNIGERNIENDYEWSFQVFNSLFVNDITLTSSSYTANLNENVTLTAYVEDQFDDPMQGQLINFSSNKNGYFTGGNGNAQALSNSSGNAVIQYTPTVTGNHMITASAQNGVSDQLPQPISVSDPNSGHDIAIEYLNVQYQVNPGNQIHPSVQVRNYGIYPETNIPVIFTLYKPNGVQCDQKTATVSSLNPNALTTVNKYLSTTSTEGFYFLKVEATNQQDSDYSNNFLSASIYVGDPADSEEYETQMEFLSQGSSVNMYGYNIQLIGANSSEAYFNVTSNKGTPKSITVQRERIKLLLSGQCIIAYSGYYSGSVTFYFGPVSSSLNVSPGTGVGFQGDIIDFDVTAPSGWDFQNPSYQEFDFSGPDANDNEILEGWINFEEGIADNHLWYKCNIPSSATPRTYAAWIGNDVLKPGNIDVTLFKIWRVEVEEDYHDLAIEITNPPSNSQFEKGTIIPISYTVSNNTIFGETANCELLITGPGGYTKTYFENITIAGNHDIDLENNWNTIGLSVGVYQVNATVFLTDDDNPSNNSDEINLEIFVNAYTITTSTIPIEGGETTGDGTYEEGTWVTVSAIPNPSWQFINWTEDGDEVSTNEEYTFYIESDRNLVANFEQDCIDPTADAGPDQTFCENNQILLSGTAENYSSLLWSGGAGTFNEPTSLTPTYIPAAGETGSIQLCLTAYPIPPCTEIVTDCMELFIQPLSGVDAGEDFSSCDNVQQVQLDGFAINYSNIQWTTSGDGFFDDDGIENPSYYPFGADFINGYVELCLNAGPINPCQVGVTDCLTLTFIPSSIAFAGDNVTICQSKNYQFADAFAVNYSALNWTTSGDGTFDNPSILNPVYTPGSADVYSGGVEICLEAIPLPGCTISDINCMVLTIIEQPYVNLPASDSLDCEFYDFSTESWLPIYLDFEGNYDNIQWTTSGDGTFSDPAAIPTAYNLGFIDQYSGQVSLSVIASNECSSNTYEISLTIPRQLINLDDDSGFVGISSYLDLSDMSVPEVLAPIKDCLHWFRDENGAYYWPAANVNQLGNWQAIGYRAEVICDCCLPLYGEPLDNCTFVVSSPTLMDINYIPVLSEFPVEIEQVFADHLGDIVSIYDWTTFGFYFPGGPSDFTELDPGRAYQLQKTGPATFTIYYPCSSGPETYTITTFANPIEGGTTDGDGVYPDGTLVTVSAQENDGWQFVNWTEAGEEVSTEMIYEFTVSADRNLVANFMSSNNQITFHDLGSSSNAYSILKTRTNQLTIDPVSNAVTFIHRNNNFEFGGHSGQLRYDISSNGGGFWNNNIGPLNPASVDGVNGARYPQLALFNENLSKNIDDLSISYFAPYAGTASFDGYVTGLKNVNNSFGTENYDLITTEGNYIPGGLSVTDAGEFWTIDVNSDDANNFRVFKGVWNEIDQDVDWSIQADVEFTFNQIYDWNFAISYDGQYGCAAVLGKNQSDTTVDPIKIGVFQTSNFGATWNGPTEIYLEDLPSVSNEMPANYIPTGCFEIDLVIDILGRTHCLLTVSAMNQSEYIDELVYNALFDIVIDVGEINAHKISDAQTYQNSYGVSPYIDYMNSRPQVSRSIDGSKIFFFWLDSDSLLTGGSVNSSPNLFGCGFNALNESFTEIKNLTSNTSYDGEILYTTVSPIAMDNGIDYEIPIVFTELSPSQLLTEPVYYHYIDNIVFSFEDNQCPLPQDWEFTITNSLHTISIPLATEPYLFNGPIQENDWIGVFFIDDEDEEFCAGAVQWNGSSNVAVLAYGDDPTTPEKDGFESGELIRWKIFDCDTQTFCDGFASYDNSLPQSSGVFVNMGLSSLESLKCQVCQEFILSENWNDLSLFIEPFNTNVENIFMPMVNDLIIMRNLTSMYWPDFSINTIGSWDLNSGYVLKILSPTEISVCGLPLDNNEILLTSEPSSWHYLPSISQCNVSTEDIFGDYVDDIIIVKDLLGQNVWWPEFEIYSLTQLIPGQAYEIKISDDVLLGFPECSALKTTSAFEPTNLINTKWGLIQATPYSHTISLAKNFVSQDFAGNQIGIFDQQDHCYGSLEVNGETSQAIIIFGDDPTTPEKDGFSENEPLEFRLWKAETEEEFLLDVEFDQSMPNPDVVFNSHGLSAISELKVSSTNISETGGNMNIQIVPNPAKEEFMLILNSENLETGKLTIYKLDGQKVGVETIHSRQTKVNISHLTNGVYILQIEINGNLFTKRLIKN